MPLIVLDTNVIVSAGLTPRGTAARIVFDWVFPGITPMVTCPSVIDEYHRVTERDKFARYEFPPKWLNELIALSTNLPEPKPWPNLLPDPTDKPFLALAHSAGAWLVTGNLKHFPEASRNGVNVLSPNEYLAWLTHED